MPFYLELSIISFSIIICSFYLNKYILKINNAFLYELLAFITILGSFFYSIKNLNNILGKTQFKGIIVCLLFFLILGIISEKFKLTFFEKIIFLFFISLIPAIFKIKIQFISNPFSGGYYYFYFLSIPLTALWFVIIIASYSTTRIIKDLSINLCFLVSIICFIASYYKNNDNLALSTASILAGVSLAYFLSNILFKIKEPNNAFIFPVGFLLGILSILGVSKKIAFVTLLFPFIIIGIPIIFFSFIIFLSYLKGISSNSNKILLSGSIWSLSKKRMILYIYITILYFSFFIIIILLNTITLSFKLAIFLIITLIFIYITRIILMKKNKLSERKVTKRINILDVPIDNCTTKEIIDHIYISIINKERSFIITPNTVMIENAQDDLLLMKALNHSHKNIPDGIGIVWAADFLGYPLYERVTGIDVVKEFFKLAKNKKIRTYLLGAKPGIAEKASIKIKEISNNIEVVGTHSGFFYNDSEIIQNINDLNIELLLVGLGSPKQENWIYNNFNLLNANVIIGVGGTIDVLAGNVKRAPLFFQKYGLEWFYRTLKEPKRIFRIFAIPKFVFHILKNKIINTKE